ncbi:WD40 domain protein, putative [Theileria annulata]|uniref:WD40 domain protein, putative n=1 Tax=Theileria annulata TaxID=5874 RepID=Q4UGH2_THEAN|nr:WD40 domain protein, putative [Theileria annulata]CAI73817.1 WD40 domain protein, putative [Theileria annulata]|eukprot:XP_954494.1 WD40 domain protein, putative [Theileria annulata]
MEVRVLHRRRSDYVPDGPNRRPMPMRNPDPALHPFSRAREYMRALIATKLSKMFAKPLISVLEGHTDSVNTMAVSRTQLTDLFTGCCKGEVRMWNLLKKDKGKVLGKHDGFVNGLCVNNDGTLLYSCGTDKYLKCWRVPDRANLDQIEADSVDIPDYDLITQYKDDLKAVNLFLSGSILNGLDHQWSNNLIGKSTAGDVLDIWDGNRSLPVMKFEWGCQSLYSVKFNPTTVNLIGSTGADNSIGLYDIRANTPIRKVILRLRSNALCWNPQNPIHFTVANEDSNLYTFDLRKLQRALLVHKDFVNSVTDVDYSPTGSEFVASSFDKCVRLFTMEGRSRDVYSNRRMQNVLCCRFSLDGKFVCSGSSDMSVRIWKANASEPVGPRPPRERRSLDYRNALMDKYKALPEIKRIQRHHHVPALILKQKKIQQAKSAAKRRREINRALYSKDATVTQEKEKPILNQLD